MNLLTDYTWNDFRWEKNAEFVIRELGKCLFNCFFVDEFLLISKEINKIERKKLNLISKVDFEARINYKRTCRHHHYFVKQEKIVYIIGIKLGALHSNWLVMQLSADSPIQWPLTRSSDISLSKHWQHMTKRTHIKVEKVSYQSIGNGHTY